MVVMRRGTRRVLLDLGSQPLDVDVEGLGVADVVRAPHPVDQRLAGQHPPGVGEQELEQLELLQRQATGSPRTNTSWRSGSSRTSPTSSTSPRHGLARRAASGASTARIRATSSRSR